MKRLSVPFGGTAAAVLLALAASAQLGDHTGEERPTSPLSAEVVALYGTSTYNWRLPAWMPKPLEPLDNPTTEAKVELGRRLFYDTRLSLNGSSSCASCHRQELAFTELSFCSSLGASRCSPPSSVLSCCRCALRGRWRFLRRSG